MCTLCLDLLSNDNATFCFSGGGGQVAGAGEVVGGPGGGVVDNNTGQPAQQQQQAKIQFNRSNSLGANHQGGGRRIDLVCWRHIFNSLVLLQMARL